MTMKNCSVADVLRKRRRWAIIELIGICSILSFGVVLLRYLGRGDGENQNNILYDSFIIGIQMILAMCIHFVYSLFHIRVTPMKSESPKDLLYSIWKPESLTLWILVPVSIWVFYIIQNEILHFLFMKVEQIVQIKVAIVCGSISHFVYYLYCRYNKRDDATPIFQSNKHMSNHYIIQDTLCMTCIMGMILIFISLLLRVFIPLPVVRLSTLLFCSLLQVFFYRCMDVRLVVWLIRDVSMEDLLVKPGDDMALLVHSLVLSLRSCISITPHGSFIRPSNTELSYLIVYKNLENFEIVATKSSEPFVTKYNELHSLVQKARDAIESNSLVKVDGYKWKQMDKLVYVHEMKLLSLILTHADNTLIQRLVLDNQHISLNCLLRSVTVTLVNSLILCQMNEQKVCWCDIDRCMYSLQIVSSILAADTQVSLAIQNTYFVLLLLLMSFYSAITKTMKHEMDESHMGHQYTEHSAHSLMICLESTIYSIVNSPKLDIQQFKVPQDCYSMVHHFLDNPFKDS